MTDYTLNIPNTPKRPTPAILETDRVKWDEETGRYWLKYKLSEHRQEGRCAVHTCGNGMYNDPHGEACSACRKYLSRLNNPIGWAVQTLKNRWKYEGEVVPFELTSKDLEQLLLSKGRWESFMITPDIFEFERRDKAEGYTTGNLVIYPIERKTK